MSLPYAWPVRRTRQTALFNVLERRRPFHFSGMLTLHANGLWRAGPAIPGYLQLAHAWQASAWLTLRFHPLHSGVAASSCGAAPVLVKPAGDDAAFAPGKRVDLVIWRHSVADTAWRSLRTQVARQAAMPRRVLKRKVHE